MSQQNINHEEKWNQQVENMAQQINFPPTPDIAGAVRARLQMRRQPRRNYRYAAAGLAVMVLILVMIPDVRAAARRFLQIGAVQIVDETPSFSSDAIASEIQVSGALSLDEARARFAEPLPDLPRPPDFVFMPDEWRVVLVWMEQGQPVSLHVIESRRVVLKYYDSTPMDVTLSPGQAAVWLDSPHLIDFLDGEQREVEDNVLIWESGDLTYRLESHLTLEDALDFARSIVQR